MSKIPSNSFLTAEYSLGLLNLQETAQAHALLGTDFDAVVSALKWEERFLALADELPAVTPSSDLLLQIQTALGHDATVPLRPSAMPPAPAPASTTTASPPPAAASSVPRPAAPSTPTTVKVQKPEATARTPAQPKPRRHVWSSLWLWRTASVVLAFGLVVVALQPKARDASAEQATPATVDKNASTAAASSLVAPAIRTAILQAPGQTSTPGWIVTFDASGDLVLTPKVNTQIGQDAAVYLWAHGDTEAPRLLAELSPNSPMVLPAKNTGPIPTGQIFEITLEPRNTTAPSQPKGPILFIGRLVALN